MNLVGLPKEVADKYRETLCTLTFNNKIVINTLTEIAKEEVQHAEVVTKVIEERLKRVKSDGMLPIMYLIDSICKNIGGPYNELFQQNLVSNFSYVFQHANEKVRALLYKLRLTWGERYHVFTDVKLHQLDQKIKSIDPAWPVATPRERPVQPQAGAEPTKIHVNPAFVGKVKNAEDETERMRAELLKKEKELLELKQQELDLQIAKYKKQMDQVDEKTEPSRDPRSRDPRRKAASNNVDKKDSKRVETGTSPRDSDSRSKKESPSKTSKSDSKKSSSSKSSSSSSKSSSSKSSSKSTKSKDESVKSDTRKRARSNETSPGSGSPKDKDGRISPLPPPGQTLGRIPKVKRSSGPPKVDEKKRGNKRSVVGGKTSPVPEKKAKPLFIETDVGHDSRDAPSPQVGWGTYKEEHPDEYRTPVKEENFNWNMEVEDYGRGRGGRDRGRFGRRKQDWEMRGGHRGRGGWNQDNGRWMNGRGGQGGPMPPFGRGGPRGGPPMMGNNLPMPNLSTISPENVRKEVIPSFVKMVEEGKRNGRVNDSEFRLIMTEVARLNEASLIKEQELRMKAQENKENHRHSERSWNGERGDVGGVRPILLGPPPPLMNGDLDRPEIALARSPPHKNDLPMADPAQLEMIDKDPTKCLPIDEQPRMIRFYGEIATIVMNDDAVCELSFKPELKDRNVIIDDNIAIFTGVNQGYKDFELDGEKHQLKIGPPTREIWVDGDWYECHFNNSIPVKIGNHIHSVFLEGTPPQVNIGDPRPDLCLGRIFAVLNGDMNNRVPIYLDRKPQKIEIAGKPHVIQFVEGFKTLTINGHPFRADFGGFPMVISVQGKKHYLRLTALPPSINLDHLPVRNPSPRGPPSPVPRGGPSPVPRGPSPSSMASIVPEVKKANSPQTDIGGSSPYSPQDESSQDGIGLRKDDPLNNLMSLFPANMDNVPTTPGSSYNTEPGKSSSMPPAPPAPIPPPAQNVPEPNKDVNINAILNSLTQFDWSSFGLGGVANSSGGIPGLSSSNEIPGLSVPAPEPEVKPPPELVPPAVITKTPKLKLPCAPIKMIVLASHHPTLKERQESIVEQLYRVDDLQCKSCGVRFSKEEMPQYTSHLDWHFRVKRREKDLAKKAQSRKWYFEKNDWIICDEIEDENNDEAAEEEEKEQEVEISTVAVSQSSEMKSVCPVCREDFDVFYKQAGEGTEEEGWYLHNAMKHEGVIYHPECFKDKNNMDTSVDTTLENSTMDTSENNVDEVPMEQAPVNEKPIKMEDESKDTDDNSTAPMENLSIKEEKEDKELSENVKDEPIKDEANEMDVKPDPSETPEVKSEATVKEEVKEEDLKEENDNSSANTSLVADDNMMLAAPVITQPKVEIKLKINSAMKPAERLDSSLSTPGTAEAEDSEFDPDAIVTKPPSQDVLDAQKPRMRGKKFQVWPPTSKDQDLSGLCSIM